MSTQTPTLSVIVYNLFGLGLGDDEDAFEHMSTHRTMEGAIAARDAHIEDPDMEMTVDDFNIEPTELLN